MVEQMPWVKVKGLACHMGLSERTVRKLIKDEGLPCSRLPSGTVVTELAQVDEWLRDLSIGQGSDAKTIIDEIVRGLA